MSTLLRLNWRKSAGYLAQALTNVILPPVCGNCKRVGALICADCLAGIVWLEEPLCQRCGRPQQQSTPSCVFCQARPFPLQQIRTATLFTGPLRTILHKMKYQGYFALAQPLAELMRLAWPKWRQPVDLALPIPLHPDRHRERGYNQSELLVRALQEELEWQTDDKALRRVRHTRPQVGLNAAEREDNVWGAFAADAARVVDKRILLVDDVRTTGATLAAAAKVLLDAGASAVSAYCLTGVVGADYRLV